MENQKETVESLKAKMWKKDYYVMFRVMEDPSKLKPVLLEHYQWMINLEKENRVFASGPLYKKDGAQGVGMTVFRVNSFEEAKEFAEQDPFVQSGGVSYSLERWQVNEGRINISVDFSDQTFSVS